MSSVANQDGVVYLLTSPSGKQYVGQSWNYEKRIAHYRRGGCKDQRVIYNAIAKYGWNNFTATIIKCGIETQEALDATEDAFIVLLNTMSPHGYNLRRGGMGGKHNVESITKMSDAKRGEKHNMFGKPAWNRGKPHSPETRAKISASMSGEKNPMFGKRGEKNPNFGRKHTAETKAKIGAKSREANRGQVPWNKGKRGAQVAWNKGKTMLSSKRTNAVQSTLL